MVKYSVEPVDQEARFDDHEIIVSKTDLKGNLLYANDVFCRLAQLETTQAIGQPHNIIRHPDMPRCVFKLLWERIQSGKEIFAYVKNMALDGKYYWVLAHVTPSYNENAQHIGYHSNRRKPTPHALARIIPLYESLVAEEALHKNQKEALMAGEKLLKQTLEESGATYDEYVWSMMKGSV
ncbi:PAS domain-containing protein [Temperatibacter marinus]|uniref:PAS domain-containing protein n=1 Tax=Temperatibacter marinus TaxID=1456591 RepID=A0AA52EIJ3_9PROT|nr:PAS domain-containing protein [Temperatibacter marinus]WND03154.1 PAS domain-containing protein [Temperatibacter marinus]